MKRSWFVTLATLGVSLAFAGTVLANHLPAFRNMTTDLAHGTLTAEVKYNGDGIKVQTKNPIEVYTLQVTFAKGGATAGWHSHPGPVFVVVRSGTLSVWDKSCGDPKTYSVGDSFFEAGPDESLLVKNESATEDALVYATFLTPEGTPPTGLRVGEPHLCGIEE
jgi:quercetin dioxygenase-like cupin family protein